MGAGRAREREEGKKERKEKRRARAARFWAGHPELHRRLHDIRCRTRRPCGQPQQWHDFSPRPNPARSSLCLGIRFRSPVRSMARKTHHYSGEVPECVYALVEEGKPSPMESPENKGTKSPAPPFQRIERLPLGTREQSPNAVRPFCLTASHRQSRPRGSHRFISQRKRAAPETTVVTGPHPVLRGRRCRACEGGIMKRPGGQSGMDGPRARQRGPTDGQLREKLRKPRQPHDHPHLKPSSPWAFESPSQWPASLSLSGRVASSPLGCKRQHKLRLHQREATRDKRRVEGGWREEEKNKRLPVRG